MSYAYQPKTENLLQFLMYQLKLMNFEIEFELEFQFKFEVALQVKFGPGQG